MYNVAPFPVCSVRSTVTGGYHDICTIMIALSYYNHTYRFWTNKGP